MCFRNGFGDRVHREAIGFDYWHFAVDSMSPKVAVFYSPVKPRQKSVRFSLLFHDHEKASVRFDTIYDDRHKMVATEMSRLDRFTRCTRAGF